MAHILSAVAWPYANGPRHLGHVAGFGVPSDVFSRYHRMVGDGDRRPVLVGAADHQHLVTGHPVIPTEDVGGDAEAGDVADVPRAVGVGPGDCGQDVPITHGSTVRSAVQPACRAGRPEPDQSLL